MSSSFSIGKKDLILCLVHKYLQLNSNPLFLWQYCFVSHDLIYPFEFLAVPKVHSVLSRPHYPHSSLLWGQPPHLHDWLLSSSITKMNTAFLYKRRVTLFLGVISPYALSLSHLTTWQGTWVTEIQPFLLFCQNLTQKKH